MHGLETIIWMNRKGAPKPGGLNCQISLSPGSPDMARPPRNGKGNEITKQGEIKTEDIVKEPKNKSKNKE